MDLVKGLIQTITWTAGKARRFTGSGRVGEKLVDRELFQHVYFSSNPPEGCEHIILKSGNLIVSIAEDLPGSRPDLSALSGAAAMHSDATHYILIKTDGTILIKTNKKVTIDSDDVELGGTSGLKKLITEDIITTLHAAVMPVSGAVAGPYPPGTFSTLLHATEKVQGK